jgi:hypothetical protein
LRVRRTTHCGYDELPITGTTNYPLRVQLPITGTTTHCGYNYPLRVQQTASSRVQQTASNRVEGFSVRVIRMHYLRQNRIFQLDHSSVVLQWRYSSP